VPQQRTVCVVDPFGLADGSPVELVDASFAVPYQPAVAIRTPLWPAPTGGLIWTVWTLVSSLDRGRAFAFSYGFCPGAVSCASPCLLLPTPLPSTRFCNAAVVERVLRWQFDFLLVHASRFRFARLIGVAGTPPACRCHLRHHLPFATTAALLPPPLLPAAPTTACLSAFFCYLFYSVPLRFVVPQRYCSNI